MGVDSTKSIAENHQRYAKYFEKKQKDAFSMDNFFTLLMAEMSNQDPLEPTSNTDFVAQLANFTALKSQQDALYYQNANYAQSLVGKTVTMAATAGGKFAVESGIVTSMSLTDGTFSVKVNGKDFALSNIMEVLPSQNPYNITGNDGAYATTLIGKKATVVGKTESGSQQIETGIVQRIEIKDNEINIIIDDKAYPIGSVVKVESPDSDNKNGAASTANDKTYATSLIGKLVTVEEPDTDGIKGYKDTGIVTRVDIVKGQVKLIIDGEEYPLEYVTRVQDPV